MIKFFRRIFKAVSVVKEAHELFTMIYDFFVRYQKVLRNAGLQKEVDKILEQIKELQTVIKTL